MTRRLTIVALGDSTTAGTPGWKSARETPPSGNGDETSQYAYWLMQGHPEWNVLNHGVDGERSDQIRGRFERDVVDHAPRAVVIIAGVNDIYQGLEPQHVIEQLTAMYERARRAGIAVVAGTIVPYNTATSEQNARMREINTWIRTSASASDHVGFVDTRDAVAAPDDPDRLFESPDDLHPSPAGYQRMANTIEPALRRALG
ncbi:MAG: SGNH/GDSL hydrolase family protein [Vicinamibacterales bacterium]